MAGWESMGAVERARVGLRMAQERERIALAVWRSIAEAAASKCSAALGNIIDTPERWCLAPVSLDGHLARRINKMRDWPSILGGEPFKIVERFGMFYVPHVAPGDLLGADLWSRFEYLHIAWNRATTLAEVRRAIGEPMLDGSGVASALAFVGMADRVAEAEAGLLAAVREYERRDREEFGGRALSVRGVLRGAGLGDVR